MRVRSIRALLYYHMKVKGQGQRLLSLVSFVQWTMLKTRMAALQGMHVSPAKHSYACLPRKCDYQRDRHTDRQTSDLNVLLCFAGDIKSAEDKDWQTGRQFRKL